MLVPHQKSKDMWFVHRILELMYPHHSVLPTVRCILRQGKDKRTVTGWLPCHHSNVGYNLEFSQSRVNRQHYVIDAIIDMKCCRKKSSLPKVRLQPRFNNYNELAGQSYSNLALWTLAVVYPSWEVVNMDIGTVFKRLVDDIENLCCRNVPHAIHVYNAEKAKVAINAALQQMGERPYNDWAGFEARMDWQMKTRSRTASVDKPSEHVRNVERYGKLWTTTEEISAARKIGEAMTPQNTTLIVGSLGPVTTPEGSCIVVRNLEDAYRVQCQVDVRQRQVYMVQAPSTRRLKKEALERLGVSCVQQLPNQIQHVQVAWSHLWGIEDWLALIATLPQSYTCIGRLDQYTSGRGQVFRDMYDTPSFPRTTVQHRMTHNVREIRTNNVEAEIAQIIDAHPSVQCFTDGRSRIESNIDTGRRELNRPYRIRTLRKPEEAPTIRKPRRALQEECWQDESCLHKNRSVVPVNSFDGVDVHAAVFLCSESTTPFDIHVARTHAREALYILNPNQAFMALRKECPYTPSVSPFQMQNT